MITQMTCVQKVVKPVARESVCFGENESPP
jgi:hypothetical protein